MGRAAVVRGPPRSRALKRFIRISFLSTGAFLIGAVFFEVRPGNVWGLTFGGMATATMLASALYAWRRRVPRAASRRGWGSARGWLQLHLYGGALSTLFALMHIGFRPPSGYLTWTLLLLSFWVTISGLLGVVLQKWIPHVLATGLSFEVLFERIPALIDELRERSEGLVQECGDAVRTFYSDKLAASLQAPQPSAAFLLDVRGGVDARTREFELLFQVLGRGEREQAEELEKVFRAKLELDAHYTLQKLLRVWPICHVPFSVLLLILVVWHVVSVAYY